MDSSISVRERGTNGLDLQSASRNQGFESIPKLQLKDQGDGQYSIQANKDFDFWFAAGRPSLSWHFMDYYVRCAYGPKTTVTYAKEPPWSGLLGLAQESISRSSTALVEDEVKKVSSCLLALANQAHAVQYVSLRYAFAPVTPAETFTMGYPEGIFFGNVFENSRTLDAMSMNLPPDFPKKDPSWTPPNLALGRSYPAPHPRAGFKYLGTCADNQNLLGPEDSAAKDPTHRQAKVCMKGNPADCREEDVYYPVFVYGPLFARLEEARPPNAAEPIQAVKLGSSSGQTGECPDPGESSAESCVGPFDPLKANSKPCRWENTWTAAGPQGGPSPSKPRALRLTEGAGVGVVLRTPEGASLEGQYTAIVRFRQVPSVGGPGPVISTLDAKGNWVSTSPQWLSGRSDFGFSWMQVFPVELRPDPFAKGGRPTLAIKLEAGVKSAGGIELDVVGFVPAKPYCCNWSKRPAWCDFTPTAAGVCPKGVISTK